MGKIRQEVHEVVRANHQDQQEGPAEQEVQDNTAGYCSQDEEHELALLGLDLAGQAHGGEEEEADPFGWGCGFD